MSSLFSIVSRELGIPREVLEREAIRLLLQAELRRIREEKQQIISKYSKYGVKNFEDFFRLVESDIISDVDVHDDLARLDYLEAKEKKILKLLDKVNININSGEI